MDWIDNPHDPPAPREMDGRVEWRRDPVYAERWHRQRIAEIEACETPEEVRDLIAQNDLLLDRLFMDFPDFAQAVTDAAEAQRILTQPRQHPRTAVPVQTPKGKRMATNPDFKKVVLKDVEFIWPRLDQTYRFNNAEKRTEPCAPTVNGASWSVGIKLPLADAKKLKAELLAHYADCASRNKKLPGETQTVFGAKAMTDEDGNPTGFVSFTAKKKAMSNAGEANKPPRVVGPDLQDLAEKGIWSGSTGHVRMLAYPTVDPDGNGGISLMLDAVQITEAVYGGDSLEDDFGPAQSPEPSFGDDTPAPAPKAAAKAVPADVSF